MKTQRIVKEIKWSRWVLVAAVSLALCTVAAGNFHAAAQEEVDEIYACAVRATVLDMSPDADLMVQFGGANNAPAAIPSTNPLTVYWEHPGLEESIEQAMYADRPVSLDICIYFYEITNVTSERLEVPFTLIVESYGTETDGSCSTTARPVDSFSGVVWKEFEWDSTFESWDPVGAERTRLESGVDVPSPGCVHILNWWYEHPPESTAQGDSSQESASADEGEGSTDVAAAQEADSARERVIKYLQHVKISRLILVLVLVSLIMNPAVSIIGLVTAMLLMTQSEIAKLLYGRVTVFDYFFPSTLRPLRQKKSVSAYIDNQPGLKSGKKYYARKLKKPLPLSKYTPDGRFEITDSYVSGKCLLGDYDPGGMIPVYQKSPRKGGRAVHQFIGYADPAILKKRKIIK